VRSVELRDVAKRFGRVAALEGVSLSVRAGEVHALLGENGAGKTTLMRILYGLVAPDAGEISIDGRPAAIRSPRDAVDLGIGMVHQHQMLVPTLTVAENVLLARRDERSFFYDARRAAESVRSISAAQGLSVDPDARAGDLPLGVAQRAEIAKALANDVSLLILDEPTAVLAPGEVEGLLATLRRLAASGVAILFVTHKLPEVLAVATRATVLRGGRVAWEGVAGRDTSVATLARAVVGGAARGAAAADAGRRRDEGGGESRGSGAADTGPRGDRGGDAPLGAPEAARGGAPLLSLRGVVRFAPGAAAPPRLDDVALDVRAGEIVGIAGVDGNGQAELARVAGGIEAPDAGAVAATGRVGLVPGDRTREGLVFAMSVWENLSLGAHRESRFRGTGAAGWLGALDRSALRARAASAVERFAIRAAGIDQPAADLSGGNQQKVALARELLRDAAVLVVMNPTRGLDVGATHFVHDTLRAFRERGGGVLLISSDLDEVLALSDRVGVLYRGRLRVLPPGEATAARVGEIMVGAL
jgi:simple sugar transport system ATP-binding protein